MLKIEPLMRDNLLVLAKAYCNGTGRTLGSLGRQVHGDTPFFLRLEAGEGTVSARKYDDVMAWFAANWPADVKRPKIQELFAKSKVFPIKSR